MHLWKHATILCLFLILGRFTSQAQLFYCYAQSSCSPVGYISNVTFSTLNNSTGCSQYGYQSYTYNTDPLPVVYAGSEVPISVDFPNGWLVQSAIGVWIDYNQNRVFEDSEFTLVGNASGGPLTKTITIPVTAAAGITGMRVRRRYNGPLTGADACLVFAEGETETYRVLIKKIEIKHQVFSDTLYQPSVTVRATIRQTDIGIDTTDSLKPRVWARKWKTNKWVSAKGILSSGTATNGQWDFTLISDSLKLKKNGCDSVQYYFVAQDRNTPLTIETLPTGANHTNVVNQINPPPTLFGFRTRPALKDTIYINSAAPPNCQCQSFTNEGGLFQEISRKGVSGPLVAIVESDLAENGAHSLDGTALNGHSLAIRPDSARLHTIEATGYNVATFKLEGVSNFMLDGSYGGGGKYLRLRNQTVINNYDTICNLRLTASGANVVIRNTIFEHQSYTVEYFNDASIYLVHDNRQPILIANNVFQQTPSANWPKQQILSTDSSSQVTVQGNDFANFFGSGVAVVWGNNWVIDSNHFYRTTDPPCPFGSDFHPVWTRGGGHQITNNYIGGTTRFAAGAPLSLVENGPSYLSGILVAGPAGEKPVLVKKNHINNIGYTSTITSLPPLFTGIFCNGPAAIIQQNMIGNTDTTTYGIRVLTEAIQGITVWPSKAVRIEGNTIAGLSPSDGAGMADNIAMAGIYTYFTDTVDNIIRENKIYHLRNPVNTFYSPYNGSVGGTIGIRVSGVARNVIEQNKIADVVVGRSSVTGITVDGTSGAQPTLLQRNRIADLVNTNLATGVSGNLIKGIELWSMSSDLVCANNQISLTNRQMAGPVTIRGIHTAYGNAIGNRQFLYNSVHIGGEETASNSSASFMVTVHQPSTKIFNNLFVNERRGGSSPHFIYYLQVENTIAAMAGTKNNHNYYVLRDTGNFAYWNIYTKPVGWYTFKNNTALDDSSTTKPLSEVPVSLLFKDKNRGDLSIRPDQVVSWEINNKALPFGNQPDDFDSTGVRATSLPATSDIGSDEFVPTVTAPGEVCGCRCRTFSADAGGLAYQWEVNTGGGFQPIVDNLIYTGTKATVLRLQNAPATWYGYKYRCLITTATGVTTTDSYELRFTARWTGMVSNAWFNPSNWECGILPDGNTDVLINAGVENYPVVDRDGICRTINVEEGATLTIAAGVTLTVIK